MTERTSSLQDIFSGRGGNGASFLKENSLPTRKNEAWHYTSLRGLAKTIWQAAPALDQGRIDVWLARLALPPAQGVVVFANGRFVPSCSSLPEGVILQADLTPEDGVNTTSFSGMLNEALEQKGLELHVPDGQDAGLLVMLVLNEGEGVSTHLRHKISLGVKASLTILEVSVGRGRYLNNPVFEIECADRAHLTHVKQQNESLEAYHLAFVSAMIGKKAVYESFTLQQGGKIARHEVRTDLQNEQAIAHVNAIQVVSGQSHHDLTSFIHHIAPHCQSRQTVRTVMDQEGTGVFQGKILVDQKAQKTDGYQMNQALLLSDSAQMNSKPELEIYADDVRCSHGATVGALDEEQLFYLRSRGIAEAQARAMLIRAFLNESLELLGDQTIVRDYLLGSMNLHD
ncbi:Fe-S cluster assembly protein SufD [Acetobacteraceae bacterium ESL0709]|nr:Fe-S cluster assembly protein SufD [Acetobacteraceae bacterium ESL0697]MDF7678323.1 Fe-S cluster assembly protein SufD [Acetobacteraceae bacterium ESL0709]